MPDIKTREVVSGTIKALDRSTLAGQRMKDAYVQTKSDLYASGIEPTREILDIASENENVDFALVFAKILRELTAQTGNIT